MFDCLALIGFGTEAEIAEESACGNPGCSSIVDPTLFGLKVPSLLLYEAALPGFFAES